MFLRRVLYYFFKFDINKSVLSIYSKTYISANRPYSAASCRAPWLRGEGARVARAACAGRAGGAGAGAARDTIGPAPRHSLTTPPCSRGCAKYLRIKAFFQ